MSVRKSIEFDANLYETIKDMRRMHNIDPCAGDASMTSMYPMDPYVSLATLRPEPKEEVVIGPVEKYKDALLETRDIDL